MNFKRSLGRILFNIIPAYNHTLYEFFARYVDRFNGDNNSNPEKNGEYVFLRNELPKFESGTVFDVGANVGDWALFALSISSGVNLHCFEPSKATYKKLAEKKWPPNVHLNNFGLGEADGVLDLNIVGEASAMNSLYLRRGIDCATAVSREQVRITTIDDYCKKNTIQKIDLIKVDVEGYELSVFRGMRRMLEDGRVWIIQFEYGGCNLDAKVYLCDIWDYLEPHGFRFYKLYHEGPRHIRQYQQSLETFKYSNWIAVHNSKQ